MYLICQVLDAGTIVEFDHPHLLLQLREGYLTSMIQQTGKIMSTQLHAAAKESYLKSSKTLNDSS